MVVWENYFPRLRLLALFYVTRSLKLGNMGAKAIAKVGRRGQCKSACGPNVDLIQLDGDRGTGCISLLF